MLSCFENLPHEILRIILIFAAHDIKTLHRCELTCRTLCRAVQDDKTWQFLPEVSIWRCDERFTTNRIAACVRMASLSIRREQESTDNILVKELGVKGWSNLVTSVLATVAPVTEESVCSVNHNRFQFRGDTLYVLAELVQENMLHALQGAHEFSIVVAEATDQYPFFTRRDLERYEPLMRELKWLWWVYPAVPGRFTNASDVARVNRLEADVVAILANNLVLRECIIRRLSRRAGIGRMTNEAYTFVWSSMIYVIYLLVRPACLEIKSIALEQQNYQGERRLLASNQSISMVPPLAQVRRCVHCSNGLEYVHTVVPGQIEVAASSLFGASKVYGNFWLLPNVDEDSPEWFDAMDRAMTEAETQYEFEEEESAEVMVFSTGSGSEEIEMHLSDEEESDDEWIAGIQDIDIMDEDNSMAID